MHPHNYRESFHMYLDIIIESKGPSARSGAGGALAPPSDMESVQGEQYSHSNKLTFGMY